MRPDRRPLCPLWYDTGYLVCEPRWTSRGCCECRSPLAWIAQSKCRCRYLGWSSHLRYHWETRSAKEEANFSRQSLKKKKCKNEKRICIEFENYSNKSQDLGGRKGLRKKERREVTLHSQKYYNYSMSVAFSINLTKARMNGKRERRDARASRTYAARCGVVVSQEEVI